MINKKPPLWGSYQIATSNLTITDRVFLLVSLIAILGLIFPHPHLAAAAERERPFMFDIENPTYLVLKLQNLPVVESVPEHKRGFKNHPEDVRVPILREYLKNKNSPAAEHADLLLKHKHYRLIVAISFAESNFCKHQIRAFNCWGIGGGQPEVYADWDQAFTRANDLIQKYHDSGLTTPRLMRDRWVGWQNDNWILAVHQALYELQTLGL